MENPPLLVRLSIFLRQQPSRQQADTHQTPEHPSHIFCSGCPHKATPAAIVEGSRSHGRTSRLPTRGTADSAHQGSEGPASDEDNAVYLKVSLISFSASHSKRQGSLLPAERRPLSGCLLIDGPPSMRSQPVLAKNNRLAYPLLSASAFVPPRLYEYARVDAATQAGQPTPQPAAVRISIRACCTCRTRLAPRR